MKKSCVAAYPVGWPDGRGISGRMRVEWVAGSPWNRWSDAHGMGGQMTVESAAEQLRAQSRARRKPLTYLQRRSVLDTCAFEILELDKAGCTVGEIRLWLETSKRIQVHRTTVQRWLQTNRLTPL